MISSRRTGRDSLLFVYGTLRPFVDIPMAQWLRRAARYVGPGDDARPALRSRRLSRHARRARSRRIRRRRLVSRVEPARFGACSIATKRGVRGKPRFVRARCVVRFARGGAHDGLGLSVLATPSSARRESRAATIACTVTLVRGDRHRRAQYHVDGRNVGDDSRASSTLRPERRIPTRLSRRRSGAVGDRRTEIMSHFTDLTATPNSRERETDSSANGDGS